LDVQINKLHWENPLKREPGFYTQGKLRGTVAWGLDSRVYLCTDSVTLAKKGKKLK
jgi:hypothetical protein